MRASEPGAFVKATLRRALYYTVGASLLLLAAGEPAWAKGLALGGLASAANFLLMALLLPRVLRQEGRRGAEGMSFLSVVIRFGLMGLALYVAAVHPQSLSLGACAAGLFAVQATIISDRILGRWFPALSAGSR